MSALHRSTRNSPRRPPDVRHALRRTGILAATCCVALALSLQSPALAHPGFEEQVRSLDAAIAADPGNASLYLQRGELHRIHREWSAAKSDYRRARGLDPALDAVDYCDGRMLLERGRYRAARAALDRFLAAHPGDAPALVTRARALLGAGLHAQAAADYTQAIERTTPPLAPMPELYLERAMAQEAANKTRLDTAVQGLDEGIRRLGPVVTLQLAAIELELKLERFDSALARLATISARSARQEAWLARKGEILARAGREAEAAEALRAALATIGALDERRRATPAVRALEANTRTSLGRLDAARQSGGGAP